MGCVGSQSATCGDVELDCFDARHCGLRARQDFLTKHVERLTEDTHALRDALNNVATKSSGVAVLFTGLASLNLILAGFILRSGQKLRASP